MLPVTLIIILTAILVVLVILSYYLPSDHDIQSNEQLGKEYGQTKNYVYTTIVLVSVALVAGIYIWLKDTIWAGHVMEWLNIVIRLMHITFGIAWIGASFYFVFLLPIEIKYGAVMVLLLFVMISNSIIHICLSF